MSIFGSEAFRKNREVDQSIQQRKQNQQAFARAAGLVVTKKSILPPYWGPNAPRGSLETPLPIDRRANKPIMSPVESREKALIDASPEVIDMQGRRQEQLLAEQVAAQKLLFKRRPIEAMQSVATANQVITQPIEVIDQPSAS